jgi:phage tail sheath gpL-like
MRAKVASLLAEFANQLAVAGVDAQRNLRLIVGQHFHRGQLRIGENQRDAGKRGDTQHSAAGQEQEIQRPAGGGG